MTFMMNIENHYDIFLSIEVFCELFDKELYGESYLKVKLLHAMFCFHFLENLFEDGHLIISRNRSNDNDSKHVKPQIELKSIFTLQLI